MSERFINPYTDYGFKKLFGTEENKELLISFLNAIIFDKEGVIANVTYKNIEQLGDNKDRRNCYFDVYCETQDGSEFIVEMQNARKSYFKDRSLFYAAKPIRDQAEKGQEWDFRLNQVYMVGVMNFKFPDEEYPDDSYYHVVQLMDVVDQHVFYDKLTLIYLEMPKLKNMVPRTDSFRDLWLYALQNLCYTDEYPDVLHQGIFKKLYDAAALANMNDAQLLTYERSQKVMWDRYSERETAREEGREEGRAAGRAEAKTEMLLEMARKMKAEGMDKDVIFRMTGLTEEEFC